jgi:hypothetical protein
MTKGYLGWRGVIKLAKELGYSWQEACEVLYRKKINPKTTFDQILICARIKYEPYRKDYSGLVYWCNPHEPINKGKLGSSQSWRKKETFKGYY